MVSASSGLEESKFNSDKGESSDDENHSKSHEDEDRHSGEGVLDATRTANINEVFLRESSLSGQGKSGERTVNKSLCVQAYLQYWSRFILRC